MRVIAGTARSLPLKAPQGLEVRPTTDKIKETLFNMLQWGIPGSVFMDLFSGSGAMGIEALSRGAKKAYFVDKSPRAVACIQQNLSFTKTSDRAIVIKQDVCIALESIGKKAGAEKMDFIFIDPPYDCGLEKEVLNVLNGVTFAAENTVIIVEASLRTDFSYVSDLGFSVIREKIYKTNKHLFLKKGNLL